MKILRRSLSIALAGLLLILMTPVSTTAQVVPQLPASYYGTVKFRSVLREADAPVGTVITALVAGVERGRIVTTVTGKYGGPTAVDDKLYVQGDISEGSTVEFYVNGRKADQTASFHREPTEINLTAAVAAGDANCDGKVTSLDITTVERIIAGVDAITPGADANLDNSINALDITKVERLIAGLS